MPRPSDSLRPPSRSAPVDLMPDEFPYDVFLSHSAKDKAVVRPLAERLRADGVKHSDFGFRHSDFGFSPPCLSANAFGSDWAQLESGTFRFRDPLNKERRFLPLRLDDAPPQVPYINNG